MKAEPWFRGVGPNKVAADTPDCIGTYEAANNSCDGYPGPGRIRPCIVRPLCIRVKSWCAENDCDPTELAKVDLFFIRDIVDGIISKTFAKVNTGHSRARLKKREDLIKMINHFEFCLRDGFGLIRFQGVPGAPIRPVAFRPGKFFLETSKRGGTPRGGIWLCVSEDKYDIELARLFPIYHGSEAAMNVAFPVRSQEIESVVSLKAFSRLRLKQIERPPWFSLGVRLDMSGVGAAASLIKRLVDVELIRIPEID